MHSKFTHVYTALISITILLLHATIAASAKMTPEYFAEKMLDVTGLVDAATASLDDCYEALQLMRWSCNEACAHAQPTNDCIHKCWAGWKYGRLACRLRFA
ncbi:hypothetical protein SprV_0301310500 [Sparganum proliferum]